MTQAAKGWQDVTAEHLLKLDADEFEEFCEALVRFEAYDRHDDPAFEGSAGKYTKDGGSDALLTVCRKPHLTKLDYQRAHSLPPLTEDPSPGPTRIVYSAKTGDWFKLAMRDAKTRAARALEVLGEGGYFKLLISKRATLGTKKKHGDKELTPHEHLNQALWRRLRDKDPNAADPSERIQIIDANTLATYLRSRQPASGDFDRWLETLELVPILRSLDDWRVAHETDRKSPALVHEDERSRVRDLLTTWIRDRQESAEEQVACLVGPPGVGKTRLALEVLSAEPACSQRVRVALSPQEALDAMQSGRLLDRHRDIVLVVDDCLVSEVREVSTMFRAKALKLAKARLLLLVPASPRTLASEVSLKTQWPLEPLSAKATQEIISQVVSQASLSNDDVKTLAHFAEGFPWFAHLLASAYVDAGRSPASMREALLWALAPDKEAASPQALHTLRLTRARSLLAATLTRTDDWDHLDEDARGRLVHAVGLRDWQELRDTALECERRGLLRRSLGWHFKYVTPQIIEREILSWLLGPDGPDPGARILIENAPERAEVLYEAFERYNLPRELVSTLVGRALADLQRATLAEFASHGFLGPRLRFLSRHRPGETAEAIRRIVEGTELTELEARVRERRSLVWNLMVLSRRPPSFEPAEAALFRLACAENEELANNATRSWAQLFSSTRNMSHRSLEARLDLLERRLDDDVGARRVALIGLEEALTNWEFGFVGEAHDDSWLQPTTEEIRAGRLRAWGLLCHRGTDPEPTIAEAARRLAAKLLRAALRQGIGAEVMDMLAEQVGAWPMSARVQLRETLEEVRAYDGDLAARSPDSLARLESALAPETFVERLRLRVGTWGPATLAQGHGAELDDALADEGLQGELPLRAELPWLLTEEAQRPHVFAFAIGRRDTASVLFTDLQALAAAHPDSWRAQALVARYLGGMVEAGRSAQAQVFADELRTNPSAAALALIEVGVTPERLAWLEDTLASGQLPPFVVEELGRRNDWLDSVDDDALLHLLGLMKGGDPAQQKAALNLMISRFGDNLSKSPPDILEALLESLAAIPIDSGTAHRWSLGAFALVERGQPARAAELALRCMSQPSNENTPFWRVLHAAASREPSGVFWVVARALDEPTVGGRLLVSFWFHRQPFVWPSEDVLEWVGDDQRRGRAAAGIVHVTSDELPVALRELIRRFGPTSSVAKEIGLRIESTQGLVSSLAEHARQQLSRVRTWLDDSDPAVATFARSLVDELEQDLERHSAYEEDMHRRFGT